MDQLTEEVEAYWLARGILLIYSAKIIHVVELLKAGKVEARYMPVSGRLHAKYIVVMKLLQLDHQILLILD